MPSPFPGMDPFLEDPTGWLDIHNTLIGEIRNYLVPVVAPDFRVRIEERIYLISDDIDAPYPKLVPDVMVISTPRSPGGSLASAPDLSIAPSSEIEDLLEDEVHDLYIEIVDALSHQVITAIEVLSPANKIKGSRGYETLRAKQQTLLRGNTHLMEIDLLRAGLREGRGHARSDYVVTLLRTDTRKHHAWFFDLHDPMPVVALPLRPPYADVPLPLQQIFNTMYDRARYDLTRDYTMPIPPPALRPADAAWVAQTVQTWLADRATP